MDYDTECDEVAGNMNPPRLENYTHAMAWVREQMPDESNAVISNVAYTLYLRQQKADPFEAALASYVAGAKRISDTHRAARYPNNPADDWRVERLQKRVRVVQGSSVHSFVDIATGDVLKAASWAVPAKHARGNIFDPHNGLNGMGPYGPAYLR